MNAPPSLGEVLIEIRQSIATITLNRPEQRNPLSASMMRDLRTALSWCKAEPAIAVVVLTGAGDRAFCAGADLGAFGGDQSRLELHRARHALAELFVEMAELGKPIVGRINGHALAGGFGLACACDLLVAVDTATFGTPEINVGVWPMMIQAILSRNLPRKVLLEMVMLGDRWTATQLEQYGLINRVVAAEWLDEETAGLAGRLAEKSTAIMRLGRDSFYAQQDMDFSAALEYLHSLVTLVTLTEDSAEGRKAFFEKRPPQYKGR
ncbi:MAG TPA: enoyl-CoA hydratase-related protein [Candidatus Dormibacteraeota bacterium]|nr:enoyl-CoA hydratase-related protein [Candidatus Dormibacteraeota bacterium]